MDFRGMPASTSASVIALQQHDSSCVHVREEGTLHTEPASLIRWTMMRIDVLGCSSSSMCPENMHCRKCCIVVVYVVDVPLAGYT